VKQPANMSVFDALGAAATILQFVDYGIKFGNKVVAVYKNRSDLAELHKLTRDFQQANETFKEVLLLRSSNPNPGEILLIKIAEDCHQQQQTSRTCWMASCSRMMTRARGVLSRSP
jgi:hypothetical protein